MVSSFLRAGGGGVVSLSFVFSMFVFFRSFITYATRRRRDRWYDFLALAFLLVAVRLGLVYFNIGTPALVLGVGGVDAWRFSTTYVRSQADCLVDSFCGLFFVVFDYYNGYQYSSLERTSSDCLFTVWGGTRVHKDLYEYDRTIE